MFAINHLTRRIISNSTITKAARLYSSQSRLKVTICGAAGSVGQRLSLMLKQCPYIDELALYDIQETVGMAEELQHIDTKCQVVPYNQSSVAEALKDAQVVAIVVGTPMSTFGEMGRFFDQNAIIVKEIMQYAAKYSPRALFAIASAPIDGTVPLASEVLKLKGVYNSNCVFGVTSLNVIRANTFAAETLGIEPECVVVPTIGGNTGKLIVPVLSQAKPFNDFTEEEIECITLAVQNAQEDMLKLKSSEGAALSSSFAIARFIISLVKGIKGHPDIVECAFVRTDIHPDTKYMAIPVLLGPNGIQKHLGLPSLSDFEKCLLEQSFPTIVEYTKRARDFLGIKDKKPCDPCDPSPRAPLCPEDYCEQQSKASLNDQW